ncbi:hypothetical protein BASA81_010799 [Batrachochytrium salamandrivorans]|nr:hypothetical protein BASA81_010799 [Batrachochytrium salamandrivorans]
MVWGKRFAAGLTIWAGAFVADTILNDDVDIVFTDRFRKRKSNLTPEERSQLPKVVILGSGWGALSMIRKLHVDEFQVTVVSPRNYFLFTPLLASTTVGTLHQRSIVEPIRQFFNRSGAQLADFLEAECTGIDFTKQIVTCKSPTKPEIKPFELEYDHLVIAVGCQSATFGIPGVQEHALFMKEINQSHVIRDKLLDCLETASLPGLSSKEQQRLLTFVVVGGGPSGIEFSAELHDFLKRDVKRNYPALADKVKVSLVEALPHVLTMFDASLIKKVEDQFRNELQIDLMLNCQVKAVDGKELNILNEQKEMVKVPYGVLVWVTGNTPRPLIRDCMLALKDCQQDRRGLLVDGHFRVKGTNNCYAIGDCAISKYPPTAQVAFQEVVELQESIYGSLGLAQVFLLWS